MSPFDKFIFSIFILLLLVNITVIIYALAEKHSTLVIVPTEKLTYKFIGKVNTLNPFLADNYTERKIIDLAHTSLFKKENNKYVPVAIDTIEKKENANDFEYKITLKDNLTFSNNLKLTNEDVLYTIRLLKTRYKESPYADYVDEVEIHEQGDAIIIITPKIDYILYSVFSVPIVPKKIWEKLKADGSISDFINLLGAGMYKFNNIYYNLTNKKISYIDFAVNTHYFNEQPHIKTLRIEISDTFEELINGTKITPPVIISGINRQQANKIGLTQKISTQTNKNYYLILNRDKDKALSSPILRGVIKSKLEIQSLVKSVFGEEVVTDDIHKLKLNLDTKSLKEAIESEGWVLNLLSGNGEKGVLSLKLLSPDDESLLKLAEKIKKSLGELSISVEIDKGGDGNIDEYDLIIDSYRVNFLNELKDVFHSDYSKYDLSSKEVDRILEELSIGKETKKMYNKFNREIERLSVVIFLYSPLHFEYFSNDIKWVSGKENNSLRLDKIYTNTETKLFNK